MIARVFSESALIVLIVSGLLGFFGRTTYGAIIREDRTAILRGLEMGLLMFLGGAIARAFIAAVLAAGENTPFTTLAVSWAFFLWPGVINTVAWLTHSDLPITPRHLIWLG